MTEQDQDLVAKLRNEATIFPMGEMHEMLFAAAGCIEALWQANDTFVGILKQNDNRKEENKTLKEQVHSLEDRVGRLGETINARETRIDELLKQLEIAQIPGNIVLCEDNARLKAEIEQLKADEDSLDEENRNLKADLSAARAAGSIHAFFKQGDIKAQSEEIAKLKQQVEFGISCMADRDATIQDLQDQVRRVSYESTESRQRMIREGNLVSQLVAALEGFANRA